MTNIRQELQDAEDAFLQSSVELPFSLKRKTTELVLNLRARRKNFGLFIILGWRNKWSDFADLPDVSQDIFSHRRVNIMNIKPGERRRYDVSATLRFDGAILIDSRGNIIHSGAMIEGLRPRVVAQKINPGHFEDLSLQFGFKHKVHLRHLTAIAASYVFKGTTIFTVSEETGNFHIFENGRIIYSTMRKELLIFHPKRIRN